MADGLAVEVVVLVELDDMPVLAGIGEELAPGSRGAGLHCPRYTHARRADVGRRRTSGEKKALLGLDSQHCRAARGRLDGHPAEQSAAVVLQERTPCFLQLRRAAFAEVAALGGDRRDQVIAVHSLGINAVARL